MSSGAKENILRKIRKALASPVAQPFEDPGSPANLFDPAPAELDILFAEKFTQLQGHFSFCISEQELVGQLAQLSVGRRFTKWHCPDVHLRKILENNQWPHPWHPTLEDCHASITTCEALVARTGSILLSSRIAGGRTTSVYAPVHVCIAYTSHLVYEVGDALALLQKKYKDQLPSFFTLASGPSRTADIEKTLVTGVHGPKEVYCFLIER